MVVGASAFAMDTAMATAAVVGRRARGTLGPVVGVLLRPPLVPTRYRADTLLARLARYGVNHRADLKRRLAAVLGPALNEVVATVDLDKAVEQVDLDAVLLRLDLDRLLARLDLADLAEGVIAEVDLAEIIRQSTGSVASDTVRGVRMQSIAGDEAVGRAVGRIRLRLGRKVPATEA